MGLKVLDLFSGIGGFSLGLERSGMTTIAFCEIEPFCQKILKQHWPDVPVFEDIKTLNAKDLPEQPDLICGGYPCQPFSVAGKQRGKEDDRHLWPEMFRIIKDCAPAWVIAENVAGHVRLGLDAVLFDLESAGYTAQPLVIPACAVNAPHRRDRVWIIAHAEPQSVRLPFGTDLEPEKSVGPVSGLPGGDGQAFAVGNTQHHGSSPAKVTGKFDEDGQWSPKRKKPSAEPSGTGGRSHNENVADTTGQRIQRHRTGGQQIPSAHERPSLSGGRCEGSWEAQWQAEPAVGRVVDGIPNRVDRIKSLGNAVVPQIPELIGRHILKVCQ